MEREAGARREWERIHALTIREFLQRKGRLLVGLSSQTPSAPLLLPEPLPLPCRLRPPALRRDDEKVRNRPTLWRCM